MQRVYILTLLHKSVPFYNLFIIQLQLYLQTLSIPLHFYISKYNPMELEGSNYLLFLQMHIVHKRDEMSLLF